MPAPVSCTATLTRPAAGMCASVTVTVPPGGV